MTRFLTNEMWLFKAMRHCYLTIMACLLLVLLGSGCGVSNTGPGSLEVQVWDHREAIGDFNELRLTFSAIGIHPAGQPRAEGWLELEPSVQELDLTQYVEGPKAVIAQATVEAGVYDAVHLTVDQASGTLLDGQQIDVEVSFDPVALDFRVRGGQTTVLGLDLLVLDVTEHSGLSYELHIREVMVIKDE